MEQASEQAGAGGARPAAGGARPAPDGPQPAGSGAKPEKATIDPRQLAAFERQLMNEQNLVLGVVGGLVAAAVGAIVWALVTYATQFQIGYMAIGVGFLVGFAVRTLGKGITNLYGIIGAALALLGCIAGNLLTICAVLSKELSVPLTEVISRLTLDIVVNLMKATFHPIDVLFYGIAIWAGYKFSFREITREELKAMIQRKA